MPFQPLLILLLLLLLGLWALSMGYRRQSGAVGHLRRTTRVLHGLARRHPERFGPALALETYLLAVELFESGRPVQALYSAMAAVDLWRALSQERPDRYGIPLQDALRLEDTLKTAIGFDPAMDLVALADQEEMLRREAEALEASGGGSSRWHAFLWQLALVIWLLSVAALGYLDLMGPL